MVLGLISTLAVAPGILHLRIRTDGHALVPTHAPQVTLDQSVRDRFGVQDPLVVLIRTEHPQGIYNLASLALVKELTETLQNLEGVNPEKVSSLATEYSDRVFPGTLNFRRFLEPFPTTAQELARLRRDIREIELYLGTVIGYDETTAAVFVGVPNDANRTDFYERILDVIDGLEPTDDRIDVIGAPVAEALLGSHILEDLGVPTFVLGHSTYRESGDGSSIPNSLYEWRVWLGRNVGLVPVALAVMAGVFLIRFRSVTAAVVPIVEVGACLVFVFALMGWLGVPVYLTIAVMPVILTAMGVADEVHIFSRYVKLLGQSDAVETSHAPAPSSGEPEHAATVRQAMDELWRPVTKTSITTAIGFLSFAMSPIGAVQAFGAFTAAGILFCMIWSLTVVPAMLVWIRPERFHRAARAMGAAPHDAHARSAFARVVLRGRWIVLLIAAGVVAVCPVGVRRVVVQDSWIDGFAPESGFYEATQAFNERFLGMHQLLIEVDTGAAAPIRGELPATNFSVREIRLPGDLVEDPKELLTYQLDLRATKPTVIARPGQPPREFHPRWSSRIVSARRARDRIVVTGLPQRGLPRMALRLEPTDTAKYELAPQPLKLPEHLERIEALEAFLAEHEEEAVGGVLGPASFLKTTNFMSRARDEQYRSIPDEPERIEWLWNQYERIRGKSRRRELIDADYARGLVTVYLKNANFVDTARLMEKIRAYEKEHLAPHGTSLSFAGDVAVSQTLIGAIVNTQVRSLLGSLGGIFLVAAVLFRSATWGFLTVLPCGLAILINFALMGWFGIPLGVATSMFAGMTLGVGVDFAIHLLERFRLSRGRGCSKREAVEEAVAIAGSGIITDALAVGLGFAVLTLSQVPANNRLGILLVLSIANCLVVTVMLLPALLSLGRGRHAERSGS